MQAQPSRAKARPDATSFQRRNPPRAVAVACVALLVGIAAQAQTLPEVKVTADAPAEKASGPVNGYVAKRSATGTKTDTPLLETPQSITVVTRDQMEAQAADSLDQAFNYSVGIVPLTGGAQRRTGTAFVVRGFNVTGAQPLYLNGSKFPINSLSGTIEPYGYERVELLKGPASILYGQAAPGGVINLVSKRPTAEPLHDIEVQLGSWDRRQVAADFAGPLNADGSLSYRVTGLLRDSQTQIAKILDDRAVLNGALDWKISADTSLALLSTYNRDIGIYDYGKPLDGTLLPNRNGPAPRDVFDGEPGFDKFNTKGQTLGYLFDHRFNDTWQFRQNLLGFSYESDYNFLTVNSRTDTATMRTFVRSASSRFDTDKGLSLDNQLVGKWTNGAFEQMLLVGLDWSKRDFTRSQRVGTAQPLDMYNPVYGTPVTLGAATGSISGSRQVGLYVQDQIKYDKHWIALIGGRYDKATNNSLAIAANGATTPSGLNSHAFTPRAGLMYVSDSGFAPYYSYTRSFQPVAGTDFFLRPFVPNRGTQHEVGLKYEPPGANVSASVAVYELTQQNVSTTDLAHPGFSVQTGEQRSRGIEIEGRASINRQLDLVGGIATTDARVTQSNTASQVGSRPTSVPRNQSSLWADYRVGEAFPGLSIGLGVRHIGPAEVSLMPVPGFTVWDAALHYQVDRWRFALNVKNLTNKTYLASCTFACFYGDERNATLTARYSW